MIQGNQIIVGNCAEILKSFCRDCIDLTVTSPPYDNLRNYNGYAFDFENIAKELYRVTKSGGVLVWVVSDATIKGSETGTSFKQALFFKEVGFNLHDTMIYSRLAMPSSAPRYSQDFEYMFVFSKGVVKTFNAQQVPCEYAGVGTSPTSRNKDGVLSGKGRRIIKDTKKKSNIWHYSAGAGKSSKDKIAYEHPAIFPEALAEDHILSWSNPGDIVLDPFCGSGTTLKMAKLNNRLYVGIDISEEYCEISRQRVEL